MFSLRSLPARRASSAILKAPWKLQSPIRALSLHSNASPSLKTTNSFPPPQRQFPGFARSFASKTSADTILEDIQDQYATARDEFEIATEETEKNTVYAADDRAAARKELDALKEMYAQALKGTDGEEVKSRVGPRIRELESAVIALEESALHE